MQKSPNKDPVHKAITKAVQNMVAPLVSEILLMHGPFEPKLI